MIEWPDAMKGAEYLYYRRQMQGRQFLYVGLSATAIGSAIAWLVWLFS